MQNFKIILRKLVGRIVGSDLIWYKLPSIIQNNQYCRVQRNVVREEKFLRKIDNLLRKRTVIGGPWKGLKYHDLEAVGSALYPKLLGTYESELFSIFERISRRSYSSIINIGFAEGYYLMALGKRYPKARLFGFDLLESAHCSCLKNLNENGIYKDRVELSTNWSIAKHRSNVIGPALVVVDCEGCELKVFSELVAEDVNNADWIVETHDFIDPATKEAVLSSFHEHHEVSMISTTSSEEKLGYLSEGVKANLTRIEQLRAVREGRPSEQEWIVAIRKQD